MHKLPKKLWVLLAILLLGATQLIPAHRPATEQEKKNMQPLITHMKTQCYGRFLLDVPQSSFNSEGDNYGFIFADILVPKPQYSMNMFNMYVDGLEVKYREQNTFEGKSFLLKSEKIDKNKRWIAYLDDKLGVGFQTRGFVLNDKTLFRVEAHGSDDEDLENFRRNFLAIAPHLHPLAPDEIPAGPGFCMTGGYIDMKNKHGEMVNSGFYISAQPEVRFNISTNINGNKVDEGVFESFPEFLAEFSDLAIEFEFKPIRKGWRTINGMQAQELIYSENNGGSLVYKFQLDIPGKPNSIREPWVSIWMNVKGIEANGKKAPIKITQAEALLLWDAVTNTLRPRPGAF